MAQRLAVTGATGFIGQALCRELVGRGHSVRALARSESGAESLRRLGVEPVSGSLEDLESLCSLIEGCTAVLHLAGAVRGNSAADFDAVNVQGTEVLLNAIRQAGKAPRFLMLSSLAAREPTLSWYAGSKRRAELVVAQEQNLDWIILRPPAVYGPGDQEMRPVFQLMARGLAFVPGSPQARVSLIHVCDLTAAIIACLASPVRQQIFELDDGTPNGYDWLEIAAIAGQHWGRQVRVVRVPRWLLDSVAGLNGLAARVTGRSPMLTAKKLNELRHPDWVSDNDRITAATGWVPRVDLAAGLARLDVDGSI